MDWLDAYRAALPSIISLYAVGAIVECGCEGRRTVTGFEAIAVYWRCRFQERPAGELDDLQFDDEVVIIRYRALGGIVQARLFFGTGGLIERSRCGPVQDGGEHRIIGQGNS